jgi:hypothetical protein
LVLGKNPFFFQIEVVVVDIIFSEPTTTSNFTLPEASYAPKDQASQLEVVNEEKKTLRLLLLRFFFLRSCRVLRRRLSFLLSSQDSAVQFWVFLWVRFRKKKNRIKIKKYDFFFFPTGQANLQVQEMLRRSCGTDKKQKKKGKQRLKLLSL